MSPTDIRTLVDHYINAYNRKDIDDMLIGVHPQVEFKNISAGVVNASTNGVAELRALAQQSLCVRFLLPIAHSQNYPNRRGLCHLVWRRRRANRANRMGLPRASTGYSRSHRSFIDRCRSGRPQRIFQDGLPLIRVPPNPSFHRASAKNRAGQ